MLQNWGRHVSSKPEGGQVMVMVENAVAQRRAELNRSMVEVSAPSRMPSFGQQQGMRGNV